MNILKRLIITAFFLLIAVSLFSQTTYPHKIVLGKDTAVVISPKQVVLINQTFLERDYIKDQNELLKRVVNHLDSIDTEKSNVIEKSFLVNKELSTNFKKSNEEINRVQILLIKEQKKSKRNLYIGGVGGVIVTSIIVFLLK